MGATRLVNVSMKPSSTQDLVYVWAVTAKGEALFRTGVSSKCPEGLDWTHVSSDVGKADSKILPLNGYYLNGSSLTMCF